MKRLVTVLMLVAAVFAGCGKQDATSSPPAEPVATSKNASPKQAARPERSTPTDEAARPARSEQPAPPAAKRPRERTAADRPSGDGLRVRNAGLEVWADGAIRGWRTKSNLIAPSSEAVEGRMAAEIKAGEGDARLVQPLRLGENEAGRVLVVTAQAKTATANCALLSLQYRSSDGGTRATATTLHTGDGAWQPLTASLYIPPGVTRGNVQVTLGKRVPAGTCLFDDVKVELE